MSTSTDSHITCNKCSQLHPGCAAHNKQGKPCGRAPRTGLTVCPAHGGLAPQVIAKANERRQRQILEEAVTTYGLPREIDPGAALLEEVHRTAGHVAWLKEQVGNLEVEQLTWGHTSDQFTNSNIEQGTESRYEAAIPVLMDLYLKERKHLVEVCKTALAAGVEERKVRIAEEQGQLVAHAINQILDGLNLTPDQQAQVPTLVPRILRAISQDPGA